MGPRPGSTILFRLVGNTRGAGFLPPPYPSSVMTARSRLQAWPVGQRAGVWFGPAGRHTHGDLERSFPLASVTKPLVAYAALVAVEEGTLDLDAAAGPEGATVRHLLAHASGLGEDEGRPLAGVGRRRIYSNLGFELLGRALEQGSGMSTADYLHLAVAEPLGLSATRLDGSPAHGAVGSAHDLALVAAEWLHPTLIHPSTLAAATTPVFSDLPGVLPGYGAQDPNPWGLGFEIRGQKAPHWTGATHSPATFGHFGRSGTFIWIDPEVRAGAVVLTDRDFGPWATSAWPPFNDDARAEALG